MPHSQREKKRIKRLRITALEFKKKKNDIGAAEHITVTVMSDAPQGLE